MKPLFAVKKLAKESHQIFVRKIREEILLIEDPCDSITLEVFEHDLVDSDHFITTIAKKPRITMHRLDRYREIGING